MVDEAGAGAGSGGGKTPTTHRVFIKDSMTSENLRTTLSAPQSPAPKPPEQTTPSPPPSGGDTGKPAEPTDRS